MSGDERWLFGRLNINLRGKQTIERWWQLFNAWKRAFLSTRWLTKIAGILCVDTHTTAWTRRKPGASGKQVFLVRFATLSHDRVSDSISDRTINDRDIESRVELNDLPLLLHRSSVTILERSNIRIYDLRWQLRKLAIHTYMDTMFSKCKLRERRMFHFYLGSVSTF